LRQTKFNAFLTKSYVVGTHWNSLIETIQMSTNNIGFRQIIRQLAVHHPLLSRALPMIPMTMMSDRQWRPTCDCVFRNLMITGMCLSYDLSVL